MQRLLNTIKSRPLFFAVSLLVPVHIFLLLWSSGGFLEMALPEVPWKRFANTDFPFGVLLIHWGSIWLASVVFLIGYFNRWSKAPQAMAIAYGLMAWVCAIETFGYMTSKTKYLAMGTEYLAYTAILLLLFKSKYFVRS